MLYVIATIKVMPPTRHLERSVTESIYPELCLLVNKSRSDGVSVLFETMTPEIS